MRARIFSQVPERTFIFLAMTAAIALAAVFIWSKASVDLTPDPTEMGPETLVLQLDSDEDPVMRLAAAWRALQHQPSDATAASQYATRALKHYAMSGDPRFLGYAEGALANWRDAKEPPLSIWLLRGRILQTQHQYAEAGNDLDRLLMAHGDSVEGMLLAADAWRRAGDIDRARSRCARLAISGWADLAVYCATDILLSLGQADKAYKLISSRMTASGRVPVESEQWTYTVAADAAAAAGRSSEARSLFELALTIPGAGIALHAAYADLLLSEDHPQEVIEMLAVLPDADAILLRRVIAAKQLDAVNFDTLRERLRARFVDARSLGTDSLHLREQALFALHIEDDPDTALALAVENWKLQKGWEDAELLIEAARASGRPDAALAVQEWRQQFDNKML